jgi:hypothetical protein
MKSTYSLGIVLLDGPVCWAKSVIAIEIGFIAFTKSELIGDEIGLYAYRALVYQE